MSGRRVKGREAIACDAVGALDALAVTGTLIAEEDGSQLAPSIDAGEPYLINEGARMPGPPWRVGPPGPQPVASGAGRGGAALI